MADANKQLSKRRIFLQRSLSTVVLWLVIAAAIAFQNIWIFLAIIALLGLSALAEVLRLLPREGARAFHFTAFLIGLAYFVATFWHVVRRQSPDFYYLDTLALVTSVFLLFGMAFRRKPKGPDALWRVVAPLFAICYIPILFSFVTRLLVFPEDGIETGAFYVLFLLVVTKFTDTGAYCVGTLIGRHKMIPRISPGKTWEGFAGALVVAVICGYGLVAFFSGAPLAAQSVERPDRFAGAGELRGRWRPRGIGD